MEENKYPCCECEKNSTVRCKGRRCQEWMDWFSEMWGRLREAAIKIRQEGNHEQAEA